MRDAGSITYSAAIESAAHKDTDATPSEFAARVEREATRRGFERAARRGPSTLSKFLPCRPA